MIAVRAAVTPRRLLYRIGRLPDPLAWPPRDSVGAGRFDDPRQRFSTLYAAESRFACFVETLANHRHSLEALAAQSRVTGTEEPVLRPRIPADWWSGRGVGRLRLRPRQRWLDLRTLETREALRGQLATRLLASGMTDLDVGAIASSDRRLTQAVAGWAHDNGFRGIIYPSRLDSALTCWALFEGTIIEPVPPISRISPDDPDLRAVAELFGLVV